MLASSIGCQVLASPVDSMDVEMRASIFSTNKQSLIQESYEDVMLAFVDIDSPTMQSCSICLCKSHSDGIRQLVIPEKC